MTNKEYSKLVMETTPKSPKLKNIFIAFFVGGAICSIGQVIKNLALSAGMDPDSAALLTSVALIFIGVFLTAVNLYDKIAKHAGAGTLVPITGFANSVASPAMEFKSEGIITGVCSKMFNIAGPVIVFSMIMSVLYGIVLYLVK